MLVTHPGIGSALLDQARHILGVPMSEVVAFDVDNASSGTVHALREAISGTRGPGGLLLLTDLPGATPANLALAAAGENDRVIAGVNLPMLLRAWNYRSRSVPELAGLALEGGRKAMLELAP